MKNDELITEFRRLSNDFENMRCLSCKNKDTLQKEIFKIDKNIGTFKQGYSKIKLKRYMRYNVSISYNEDISISKTNINKCVK